MPLAQLDLGINVNAQSAISGFNKAGDAAQQFGNEAKNGFKSAEDGARKFDNAMKQTTAGLDRSKRAMQAVGTNMTQQFQDIGVMAQYGANSMTIALQQGTQLGEALKTAVQSGGGLKALGGALLSMVHPISLLTIGFTFLAAEAIKYVLSMQKEIPKVEDVLKAHADAISQVAERWPEAAKGMADYPKQLDAITAAVQDANLAGVLASLEQESKTVAEGMTNQFRGMDLGTDKFQPFTFALNEAFTAMQNGQQWQNAWNQRTAEQVKLYGELNPELAKTRQELFLMLTQMAQAGPAAAALAPAFMAFQQSVAAGKPDIVGLVSALQQLKEANPAGPIHEQAQAMLLSLQNAGLLTQAVLEAAEGQRVANAMLSEGSRQVLAMATTAYPSLNQELITFQNEMMNGGTSTSEFVAHLQEVKANTPDKELQAVIDRIIAMVSEINTVPGAWDNATAAADQYATAAAQASARGAMFARLSKAAADADAQAWDAASAKMDALTPDLRDVRQRVEDAHHEMVTAARSTAEIITADSKRVLALKAIAQQEAQIAAERKAREKHGGGGKKGGGGGAATIPGTDMTLDQLEQWSHQMQIAIDPTIKLKEEQDKLALAIQKGAFPAALQEQALAKLQEQYGKTASKAFDLQKTFGDMMSQWGDQVASSLADAIVNGEDLGDVFKDLIKQLAKMALEMLVLKPLMGSIMSAIPGVGGIAGAAAPATMSSPARSLPAPGMLGARSATIGGGRASTIMSSVGGVTINFGGGNGNGVEGDSHKAKLLGERMREAVQTEMVRQSRPGGLLWAGGR